MKTQISPLDQCPTLLPPDLCRLIGEFGKLWARSEVRPRIDPVVATQWTNLLDEWISETDLPLLIRKGGSIRGLEVPHDSGRRIILCDNSPAHWSYTLASRGECPTIAEIESMIRADRLPVVMIQKAADRGRASYNCSLSPEFNVNKLKWKLAHILPVGTNTRKPISQIPWESLIEKFRNLLLPSNMFVVPIAWGGLAETPEVVEAIIAEGKPKKKRKLGLLNGKMSVIFAKDFKMTAEEFLDLGK